MALGRKYAALPDLDEAPDIYETPDLIDDASTVQTSSAARSSSPASETSEIDVDSGISRHRLQPNVARTQFRSSRIDARGADFSDRVSSKRRAYKVSSQRARNATVVDGNDEVEEDWASDDDDHEGLQRRLARLLRETEELQSELERRAQAGYAGGEEDHDDDDQQHAPDDNEDGEEDVSAKVKELSLALDRIRNSQRDAGSAHAKLARQLAKASSSSSSHAPVEPPSAPATKGPTDVLGSPDHGEAAMLSRVADFDARLASIERLVGTSSLDTPEALGDGSRTSDMAPLLSTLSMLDRQVTLLSSVPSQPHLDAIVQKLHEAQSTQPTAQPPAGEDGSAATASLTPEDMAKLRSLHALLPALSSLTPTLPPLLARLRSLRILHANAANASQALDAVEEKQDEADKEIATWVDGLTKVEAAVRSAEGGMQQNVQAVEKWVKDLEDRLGKLGA